VLFVIPFFFVATTTYECLLLMFFAIAANLLELPVGKESSNRPAIGINLALALAILPFCLKMYVGGLTVCTNLQC